METKIDNPQLLEIFDKFFNQTYPEFQSKISLDDFKEACRLINNLSVCIKKQLEDQGINIIETSLNSWKNPDHVSILLKVNGTIHDIGFDILEDDKKRWEYVIVGDDDIHKHIVEEDLINFIQILFENNEEYLKLFMKY